MQDPTAHWLVKTVDEHFNVRDEHLNVPSYDLNIPSYDLNVPSYDLDWTPLALAQREMQRRPRPDPFVVHDANEKHKFIVENDHVSIDGVCATTRLEPLELPGSLRQGNGLWPRVWKPIATLFHEAAMMWKDLRVPRAARRTSRDGQSTDPRYRHIEVESAGSRGGDRNRVRKILPWDDSILDNILGSEAHPESMEKT